ncbi:hypothetical protein F444_15373, partial [Phytophthora nicotianae P1976]
MDLLGEPSAVPDTDVERFLADADKHGADLSRGVRWKMFKAFLAQVKRAGSHISLKDFEYNRQRTGTV